MRGFQSTKLPPAKSRTSQKWLVSKKTLALVCWKIDLLHDDISAVLLA